MNQKEELQRLISRQKALLAQAREIEKQMGRLAAFKVGDAVLYKDSPYLVFKRERREDEFRYTLTKPKRDGGLPLKASDAVYHLCEESLLPASVYEGGGLEVAPASGDCVEDALQAESD